MESHEVHPGMAVQVREDRRRPEFEGMLGIIRGSHGAPDHLAVEVELEDGQLELFWFHQLDTVNMGFPIYSVPFYDGS